jgi:ribokinase
LLICFVKQTKNHFMPPAKIIVIGSSNTDMVVKSDRLPAPGETILGGDFLMNPGGKGANQAVAAAKLGGEVTFVAKVGKDIFGAAALDGFRAVGIDTQYIREDANTPSGVALIMVDDSAENCISVALGANATLNSEDIDQALSAIEQSNYLLIQLESPLKAVEYAVTLAKDNFTKVVLNPAPAQTLSDQLLSQVDILTPNETEAALLTGIPVNGIEDARKAAQVLRNKGVGTVIITLGAKGAYVQTSELDEIVPSPAVKAVDTTAAGDTFNGALVVALAEGLELLNAVEFANRVAAYSVTKMGAQTSCPTRADLDE